jgi:hypothetical protein
LLRFEPNDKIEGINYWFAKVVILLKIFTKIKIRDLATIRWATLYPKLTFRSLGNEKWLNLEIPSYEVFQDVDPLLNTYKLLEPRRRLGLRSDFILIHPDYSDRCSGRNYLRESIKKELKKMDLSVNDISNLRDHQNVLSELLYVHRKSIEPSLEKAFRRYKGVKSNLSKQDQINHKKVSGKNHTYTEKRNAIRQELYGEVSDKELEMIVDALMELGSPNSFSPGDSKDE